MLPVCAWHRYALFPCLRATADLLMMPKEVLTDRGHPRRGRPRAVPAPHLPAAAALRFRRLRARPAAPRYAQDNPHPQPLIERILLSVLPATVSALCPTTSRPTRCSPGARFCAWQTPFFWDFDSGFVARAAVSDDFAPAPAAARCARQRPLFEASWVKGLWVLLLCLLREWLPAPQTCLPFCSEHFLCASQIYAAAYLRGIPRMRSAGMLSGAPQ